MAIGYIDPRACIGMPPEHREYRWRALWGQPEALGFYPEIHPTAIIEAFVSIDSGIENPTYIGKKSFIMKHAHIGHDAHIGEKVNIAPGVIVGGYAVIGDNTKIGLGASIRPRVKVGKNVIIGAGAVVVKNIPDEEIWVGNPAHPLYIKEEKTDLDIWHEWWNKRE